MSNEQPILRLRAMEPSDVELLYAWENDRSVWRVSGTMTPLSRERIAQFIAEQSYDLYATRQMRLIIEVEGVAVGSADIFEFDPYNLRFGIGILIYAAEHRRRGYARAAIEQLKEYGRESLGIHQIWAEVAADNVASIALFEECGFEVCGRHREWLRRGEEFIDQLDYQLLL